MPWTEITRRQYRREGLRYSSDVTDAEWRRIAPHLPPAKPLGRPRDTDLRQAVNAMLYLLTTGCPVAACWPRPLRGSDRPSADGRWRQLPKEFPPYSTVQRFFYAWRDDGTWRRINHLLLLDAREAVGREASPLTVSRRSIRCPEGRRSAGRRGGRRDRQPVGEDDGGRRTEGI